MGGGVGLFKVLSSLILMVCIIEFSGKLLFCVLKGFLIFEFKVLSFKKV